MNVRIDDSLCTGCGLCVDTCPEVFEMPEAVSTVKSPVVPEELADKVKEAAESCPVEAIIIEE
ncbi:MAG: ferredoxin [Candidatus Omnitrophica bacterium]|nr:ferredoxin [Candidatus Omnitrophota bacterium]